MLLVVEGNMPQWLSVLALRLYTCEPYSLIYEYLLMPMFWSSNS